MSGLNLFGEAVVDHPRPGPDPESEAHAILSEAIRAHSPLAVLALFSGGDDSVCAAHLASRQPGFVGCLMADTTIAVPEAHEHVRATCERFGWPLIVKRAPVSYAELVLERGFPGPAMHWKMYQRLKERCFQAGAQEVKAGRKGLVMLVGGRRRLESPRRLRRLVHPIEIPSGHGVTSAVFASPLFYWTGEERDAYRHAYRLPTNPVKAKLCNTSGDCLCGAMADQGPDRGERKRIEHFYPEVAAQLSVLEAEAARCGVWPVWGVKPPSNYAALCEMPTLYGTPYGCTGCEWRAEAEEDARELDRNLATLAASPAREAA